MHSTDAIKTIAGMHWYDGAEGYTDPYAPTLAICMLNGRCQLFKSELDDSTFSTIFLTCET